MKGVDIHTVIFDLGGVLVDWNPYYLYKDVFEGDEQKASWFLNNICTSDWNEEQDAGRSLEEATRLLTHQFPDYHKEIELYYGSWETMLRGAIDQTVQVLDQIRQQDYRLLALTNWSTELFPVARRRFEFLQWFEGIVVSGDENCRKPFPEIYKIIIDRYALEPANCLFIDDNKANIEAAARFGIHGIHFKDPMQLKEQLNHYQIRPFSS